MPEARPNSLHNKIRFSDSRGDRASHYPRTVNKFFGVRAFDELRQALVLRFGEAFGYTANHSRGLIV